VDEACGKVRGLLGWRWWALYYEVCGGGVVLGMRHMGFPLRRGRSSNGEGYNILEDQARQSQISDCSASS